MNIDKGEKELTSIPGACCSLVLLFAILSYGWQKAGILVHKKDYNIMQSVKDYHFTSEDVFSYEKGFNVAFAFTAYDDE